MPKNRCFYLVILVAFSSLFWLGCDNSKKKKTTERPILPKQVTLPSGEKVQINKSELNLGPGSQNWQRNEKAKRCVETICKVEDYFAFELEDKTYVLTANEKNKLPEAEREFELKIWPKLLDAIEAEKKDTLAESNRFQSAIARIPKERALRVSPATESSIKYAVALSLLKRFEDSDYDEEQLLKSLKLVLKDSVLRTLSQTERESIEPALVVYNKFLTNYYLESDFPIIEALGLRTYILKKYDKSDYEKSKALFLKDLNENINLLKIHSPIFYKLFSEDFTLQKLLNGRELLPAEEANLATNLSSLELYKDLIKHPWPELDDIKIDFASLLNGQNIAAKMQKYIQQNNSVSFAAKHEASIEKTYQVCKTSISTYLATRPSNAQINRTRELISKVKSTSKVLAKQFFKGSSQNKIDQLIKQVEFSLPYSKEEASAKILPNIQALINIVNDSGSIDPKDLNDKDFENYLGLFVAFNEVYEDKPDDEYSSISDFCLTHLPKELSDMSVTIENRIITSARTVQAGVNGAGVIAHEIGHRLQSDLSGSPDSTTLNCLRNRHIGVRSNSDIDKAQDNYLEEDFADQFSISVLNKLGYKNAENNFACLFFRNITDSDNGQALPFYPPETLHPLLSLADDDEHSSPTFRLLQVANDLGHVTPLCKQYIETETGKDLLGFDIGGEKIITPIIQQCVAR